MEAGRKGGDLPFKLWEPFVWEYSSAISSLILIPLVITMLQLRPLQWGQIKVNIPTYVGFSIIFSLLHVAGMVAIRHAIYWTQNMSYQFGDIPYELLYEYRKDFWSFGFIITVILSYQFILARLLGEASLVKENEDPPVDALPERFLIKKLGKEFIIKISDIEWLESSGNYVNLPINGRIYPIRSTLSGLVKKISRKGFCQIHRSYGVNIEFIDSISPQASGDSEIKMISGKRLKLSRRYKDQLKVHFH